MRRRARSLAFRPVVVYDGAFSKVRLMATVSPLMAKANFKKATRNRRKAKSWSESHCNGKTMRCNGEIRSLHSSMGVYENRF